MYSRVKTIEVTKDYCHAFNERDFGKIESLLDPHEVIFSRQGQPTIVGVSQIMNRTHNLFQRLDDHAHHLHMVNAIIDLPDTKARPCLLGMMDGERFSVVLISCRPNGLIQSIAILMGEHNTGRARPLEPLDEENHKKEYHEEKKHKITKEEIEERRKGLQLKAQKLEIRVMEEGATPLLLEKFKRLKEAEKKLQELAAQLDH